jgi:hypothetical protein
MVSFMFFSSISIDKPYCFKFLFVSEIDVRGDEPTRGGNPD